MFTRLPQPKTSNAQEERSGALNPRMEEGKKKFQRKLPFLTFKTTGRVHLLNPSLKKIFWLDILMEHLDLIS